MKPLNFKNMAMRISYIRGDLSKAAFARELSVSPSYIGMLEDGKNTPSEALSELICIKFRVNKEWLLTGEGEMERKPGDILYNNVSEVTKLIVQVLQEMPEEAQRDILKHVEEKKLLRELMKERKERKEGA